MPKKPWMMEKRELADRHEEAVAKALDGRVQKGSGSVKVAFMRGDVLSPPFMIECKSTAKPTITIQENVWTDLKGKTKQTTYLPAYSLSVVDSYGTFYDVVGIQINNFTDKLLRSICPNGMLQHLDVKKTKAVQYVEACVKQKKYLSVYFENLNDTLLFVPLDDLAKYYDEMIGGLR